jgi:hypothetical protein
MQTARGCVVGYRRLGLGSNCLKDWCLYQDCGLIKEMEGLFLQNHHDN